MVKSSEIEAEFRLHYRALGMYALRILGNVDEAEDAVQQVFATLFERAAELDVHNIRLYAYRAVRNEALRRLELASRMVEAADLPEVCEEDIDTSERDARIWSAIDALPERCREVFLLSKRDGLSNADIAAELGISVKTVENQMTKALSRMRGTLRPGLSVFFLPFL